MVRAHASWAVHPVCPPPGTWSVWVRVGPCLTCSGPQRPLCRAGGTSAGQRGPVVWRCLFQVFYAPAASPSPAVGMTGRGRGDTQRQPWVSPIASAAPPGFPFHGRSSRTGAVSVWGSPVRLVSGCLCGCATTVRTSDGGGPEVSLATPALSAGASRASSVGPFVSADQRWPSREQ